MVDHIEKSAVELDTVIKELGKILELRREPQHLRDRVDLSEEWQRSVNLHMHAFSGAEKISADFSALPTLLTVRPIVQSLFFNLMSNALKFRSPDRPLQIDASSHIDGEKAIIVISDNGVGLDVDSNRDKLFRLYTRFHSHVEGRGLGLYLVKAQLEVISGSISIQSTPGTGATFHVTIPLLN
jgi:signal transduction histidine kinase